MNYNDLLPAPRTFLGRGVNVFCAALLEAVEPFADRLKPDVKPVVHAGLRAVVFIAVVSSLASELPAIMLVSLIILGAWSANSAYRNAVVWESTADGSRIVLPKVAVLPERFLSGAGLLLLVPVSAAAGHVTGVSLFVVFLAVGAEWLDSSLGCFNEGNGTPETVSNLDLIPLPVAD